MIWNEPNNKSHWDFEIDKDWQIFSKMVIAAGEAVHAVNARLPRVLGGISPIDPNFIQTLERRDVLKYVDVVAVHGFHFEDHRLDDGVRWLKELGVRYIRTGLSWADSYRPNALEWFDRQMKALEPFDVTVTYCFTPEHKGIEPHYTSPPQDVEEFADFCARMTQRYAR